MRSQNEARGWETNSVTGGTAPIFEPNDEPALYANPLPSALILTAIVVSLATLAVGLAITVRVNESYGSVESDDIAAADALNESDLSA